MSLYMGYSESSDIIVTQPVQFIAGAEKEIKRIDAAIDCFKSNSDNNGLIVYLESQKGLLKEEISLNKEFVKDISFSTIGGKRIENEKLVLISLDGIDYIKAYKDSKNK